MLHRRISPEVQRNSTTPEKPEASWRRTSRVRVATESYDDVVAAEFRMLTVNGGIIIKETSEMGIANLSYWSHWLLHQYVHNT